MTCLAWQIDSFLERLGAENRFFLTTFLVLSRLCIDYEDTSRLTTNDCERFAHLIAAVIDAVRITPQETSPTRRTKLREFFLGFSFQLEVLSNFHVPDLRFNYCNSCIIGLI